MSSTKKKVCVSGQSCLYGLAREDSHLTFILRTPASPWIPAGKSKPSAKGTYHGQLLFKTKAAMIELLHDRANKAWEQDLKIRVGN